MLQIHAGQHQDKAQRSSSPPKRQDMPAQSA
jgi:hypothetical protein